MKKHRVILLKSRVYPKVVIKKIAYHKFTIDISRGQNKTTISTQFFGKRSSLKLRLGKLLDKLSDVLLKSGYTFILLINKIYRYSSPKSVKINFFSDFLHLWPLNGK